MDDVCLVDKEDFGSAHTRAREVHGEVLSGPERRRRWSLEEKLRILAQSVAPWSSPSLVCRLHGISSGQLYTWRRQLETSKNRLNLSPNRSLLRLGDAGDRQWRDSRDFLMLRSG